MITIIDYGLGNLGSVGNALKKLEIPFQIADDPVLIGEASSLMLPGVGAAGEGMKNLKEKQLVDVIKRKVQMGTPLLGICLGMQLLMSWSEEGNVECLGLVKGKVKKFTGSLKIPQIGWNNIHMKNGKKDDYVYFVNSFYCEPEDKSVVVATTEYGREFCSIFVQKNLAGMQFHPEKSGEVGLTLLLNFYRRLTLLYYGNRTRN